MVVVVVVVLLLLLLLLLLLRFYLLPCGEEALWLLGKPSERG